MPDLQNGSQRAEVERKPRSKPRSHEAWLALAEEWRRSGLDEAAFCASRGVSRHTFRKHRYRGNGKQQPAFKPVAVTPAVTGLRVRMPNGITIEVPGPADLNTIAQLAKALS